MIQFLVKSVMFYSALRRLANGFHIYGSNSRYAEIDIQLMTQVCFFRKKKLWQNKWKIFRLFKNYFRWLLFLFHLILFFNGQLQVFEVTIYGIYTQWKITKMVGYEEPPYFHLLFYDVELVLFVIYNGEVCNIFPSAARKYILSTIKLIFFDSWTLGILFGCPN